ncbi:PhzF family phenazine biosynthesis isomerase [Agrobacterium vitis]|uniref:PhzF family phenazine biosynthesis protein n=1 Tax=Agrobacterium vitis TaxID=373 RepID=UPI001F3BD5B9|nr:PhzF family phenazine biosynthesis protein [Agrobacterium vitis]MCE6077449.1 PhzF family phenazine biosynthesis isomerase [Agrobacterium vitis]
MHVHRVAAFTKDGAGGNPAGVVLAPILPSRAEMQTVAADVGYSETVFAAPKEDGSWIVRYFSPEAEVPFCGHATIALGTVLGQEHGEGRYALSLANTDIEVESGRDGHGWWGVLRSPATRSSPADPAALAEALALFGYSEKDLDQALPPRAANAGTEHLFISLASRTDLARMSYDLDRGREFMGRNGIGTVAFMFREQDRLFHARNAFAIGGVLEDPATGSAAAAFAGVLRDLGVMICGRIVIIQGEDMGQPCRIEAAFGPEAGSPVEVRGLTSAILGINGGGLR